MREPTNDERLDIENRRYGNGAFWCLPLAVGGIAILTPRRDFYALVDTWEEACLVGPKAEAAQKQPVLIRSNLTLNLELDL